MNLVEVMVAAVVFGLAANASAQLWGSSALWSQRAEQRQELMRRLDADLLRREHGLRRAALAVAPAADCAVAGDWLEAQLQAAATELPAGVTATLQREEDNGAGGLWLVLRSEHQAIERRRLFMAAAHGLCQPLATDTELGA
ncbi:hypothetical protein KBY93_09090 [Synechococcus sp. J7-Johnson]|uniref:hypothetical protein n=1 Tax=Synechococcus sp. J7-Johnson TaxID=2823737 RepID=UPI0020CCA2DE|nr:hypothetical protein [Synechococcus sp. J7-Johnson]MCP9840788.1 hypothetical protein [Synechococcus sp. J7-Johnson]